MREDSIVPSRCRQTRVAHRGAAKENSLENSSGRESFSGRLSGSFWKNGFLRQNGNRHGSAFPDDKSDCSELNRAGKSASRHILPKKQDTADAEALLKNLTERRKKGFSDAVIIAVDTRMDTGGGKGERGDF